MATIYSTNQGLTPLSTLCKEVVPPMASSTHPLQAMVTDLDPVDPVEPDVHPLPAADHLEVDAPSDAAGLLGGREPVVGRRLEHLHLLTRDRGAAQPASAHSQSNLCIEIPFMSFHCTNQTSLARQFCTRRTKRVKSSTSE